jgi:GNAT superfamily N-acetyltransferase
MIISPLQPIYERPVAQLHEQGIQTGFLSKCGIPFLSLLYRGIASTPTSTVLVAIDTVENSVIGFVAASCNTSETYRLVLIKYALPLFVFLLPTFMRISNIIHIIETLLYPYTYKRRKMQEGADKEITADDRLYKAYCKAELLSIVVNPACRKKGVGKNLIKELNSWFNCRNIKAYKVVTLASDAQSNLFYRNLGFLPSRQFQHHENVMNEYLKAVS